MKRFVITIGALLALAVPASSSAAGSAHWITDPTCTATLTALACTGQAAGVQPKSISGLGPLVAGIQGEIHYTCLDPFFPVIFFGFPPQGADRYFATAGFHNGQTFSVQFVAPPSPPELFAQVQCTSGLWTRDPNYYNVRVVVGWGLGSFAPIEALEAAVGNVSPG
jgi:hypothetical protein